MRCVEGNVQEQRLRLVTVCDHTLRRFADQLGGVALLVEHLAIAMPVKATIPDMRPIVDRGPQMTV